MKDAHENLPYHAKLLIFLKLIHLCDVLPTSGELDISSNQHLTFKNVKFDFLDESDVLVLEPVCATINNSLQIGDGSKMKMNDTDLQTSRGQIKEKSKEIEDAFFRSHPRSVQRTVEFVIDRVVSNCVKQCRNQLIPDKLREINNELKEYFNKHKEELESDNVRKYIDMRMTEAQQACLSSCLKFSNEFIDTSVDRNLEFLFTSDIHDDVMSVGKTI